MAAGPEIERLIALLARLPGLGPRSARRAALHLIKRRETALEPLTDALAAVRDTIVTCSVCGNFDSVDPCTICADEGRDATVICVVEDVAALWAMERASFLNGRYHVLGGVLSAIAGTGPDELNIPLLVRRAARPEITEVILALSATVDGQTTSHYIADQLARCGVTVSGLAHGVPVGGELDYLDDGTIGAALKARRPV